jgi:hypothetical protein
MPENIPATPAPPAPVAVNPAPVDPKAAPVADPAPNPAPADPAAPAGTEPTAPAAEWPEDWRAKYAAGDDKKLKKLERYGSPQAALDALFNAQARISSGALKEPLKADATPEELNAWRAENGIPESPDKYELALPDGLVIGEADKPFVDDFLASAHGKNMDSKTVSAAVGWFLSKQEEAVAQQAARDTETRMKTFEQLRDEYGPEYKKELKIAMAALDNAPEGIKDAFLAGRLADGTMIGDSPEVIRWLNNLSRQLNPVGVVVPGSGTNAVQAVEAEIAGLRKQMGDKKSDYWKKGPVGERLQSRYRELTTALSKGK